MAFLRYQPQGRLAIRPEWIQRGLAFAWVASQPAVNAAKSASIDVRVGQLVYNTGPRGFNASSFSYPSLGNRLIADPRITGFSGTGTFIAGGMAAGDGTFMSIGTAGQGVRTSIRSGNAAMTYMGVADYPSSIAMPSGPATLGVAIGKNSAALVALTAKGISTQTLSLGNPVATTEPLRIGSTGASDNWPGSMDFGYYFTQTLSSAEMRELVNNPWALFIDQYEDDEIVAAGGGTNTTVTPNAGSFALSGYVPTVAQTANQAVSAGLGSMTFAGYAPSIAQMASSNISPSAGALNIAGYAPTIMSAVSVLPSSGAVSFVGYAPTVVRTTSTNTQVTADVQVPSIAFSGWAPTIARTASQSVTAGVASIALTGYAPLVAQRGPIIELTVRYNQLLADDLSVIHLSS